VPRLRVPLWLNWLQSMYMPPSLYILKALTRTQTLVPQVIASPEFYASHKLFGGRWNVPDTSTTGAAAMEKRHSDLLDFYVAVRFRYCKIADFFFRVRPFFFFRSPRFLQYRHGFMSYGARLIVLLLGGQAEAVLRVLGLWRCDAHL
jgi:hypothetical protein